MEKVYALVNSFFAHFLKIVPQRIIDAVGADKVQHFFAGALIALIALVGHIFIGTSLMFVLYAPAVAGVIKEILDYILNRIAISKGQTPTHGVDIFDAIATALGGVAVFGILHLF